MVWNNLTPWPAGYPRIEKILLCPQLHEGICKHELLVVIFKHQQNRIASILQRTIYHSINHKFNLFVTSVS